MTIHRIVNAETGEVIERPYTEEEMKEYESNLEAKQAELAQEQAKAEAKAALLAQLGITEEQAKLLLS